MAIACQIDKPDWTKTIPVTAPHASRPGIAGAQVRIPSLKAIFSRSAWSAGKGFIVGKVTATGGTEPSFYSVVAIAIADLSGKRLNPLKSVVCNVHWRI
ncbi:MAG: hypothetical protein ACKOAO_00585 [Oxalobacteraceae bacterium]